MCHNYVDRVHLWTQFRAFGPMIGYPHAAECILHYDCRTTRAGAFFVVEASLHGTMRRKAGEFSLLDVEKITEHLVARSVWKA